MENNQKTEPDSCFDGYGLSGEITETLTLLGYEHPTRVQEEVLPYVLAGRNVVVRSQTGTGKTAAFAIPVCEQIVWEENLPQALVLEPSRELAVQVSQEIFRIGRKKRLKVPAVFGGFPIDKQIQTLRQKTHIVVGTPGRVMDHVRRGSLKLTGVRYLVIDEADLMLDMGFMDEVRQIVGLLPEKRQTLLFSATLDEDVKNLAEETVKDAVSVFLEQEGETPLPIRQSVYGVAQDQKYTAFKRVLMKENPERAMIFCGTREMVQVLFQKLRRDRIFCGMIHGDMEQKERLKNVDAFRRGGFRYLIATDVAARGIDFEDVGLVVNYDFPMGRETYVHRIGRTGRNGKAGRAASLVTEDEIRTLHKAEAYVGVPLPVLPCPETEEEEEKAFWALQRKKPEPGPHKGEKLDRSITRLSIGGGRKSKMRSGDIVGAVCSIEGVDAEDIGIIDIRESLTFVEILNRKGSQVLAGLQDRTIKGKIRKVRITSQNNGV